jgi:hypothetical protein
MNSVLGMNFFVFCFLALIVVFYFSKEARDNGLTGHNVKNPFGADSAEAFEANPVVAPVAVSELKDPNRKPDQDLEDHIQSNLTQKAIMQMTPPGSDDSGYAPA